MELDSESGNIVAVKQIPVLGSGERSNLQALIEASDLGGEIAIVTPESLHHRIQKAEHRLYPEAVRTILARR